MVLYILQSTRTETLPMQVSVIPRNILRGVLSLWGYTVSIFKALSTCLVLYKSWMRLFALHIILIDSNNGQPWPFNFGMATSLGEGKLVLNLLNSASKLTLYHILLFKQKTNDLRWIKLFEREKFDHLTLCKKITDV